MKKNKLIWNVLLHDFNKDTIEDYNVFDHAGFRKDLKNQTVPAAETDTPDSPESGEGSSESSGQ